MPSFRSLALPALVLICMYQPAVDASLLDTAINFVANKALGTYMTGGAKVQPSIFRVVDAIAHKRRKRGDKEGAAHASAMKQWFSFFGIRKGIPAIAMQMFSHRGAVTDSVALVVKTATKFQVRVMQVGFPQTWQEQSHDVTKATKTVVHNLKAALPTGPFSAFFKDVGRELKSEHLASDILEEVLPSKEQRQNMMDSFQKYFGMLRSAINTVQNGNGEEHNTPSGHHDRHSHTGSEL